MTDGRLAFPRLALISKAMRPRHWVKNVFVLAPAVFARRLDDPDAMVRVLSAFIVFSALSSA
ncbi:MAG: hypothetical protein ACREDF_05400, partial [Thermoplasmata archaeon]